MSRKSIWRSRKWWSSCRRPRTTSWSEIVTLVCQCLSLSVMVPNDFPYQKTLGVTTKTSLYQVQNQRYNFTPWSCACPPTAPPSCYCLFSSSKSQMISHAKKPWVWQQKQVSTMFRTKVTISLLEVLLGLLQHLHPVLDIQVNLDSWRWSPMIFHIQKPVFSH